jgi:hypothetical protein
MLALVVLLVVVAAGLGIVLQRLMGGEGEVEAGPVTAAGATEQVPVEYVPLVPRDPQGLEQGPPTPSVPAPMPSISVRTFSTGLPPEGAWRGRPYLGDFDGDGDLDLAASLRVARSPEGAPLPIWDGLHVWTQEEGVYTEFERGIERSMGYGGADGADFDGDGRLDIAFSAHDVAPRLFLGGERWRSCSLGLVMSGAAADVAAADYDSDGRPELAVIGMFPDEGGLLVFDLRPEECVWDLADQVLDDEHFGGDVRTGDVDGDGKPELLAVTDLGPRVWRYVGDRFVEESEGLPAPEYGGSDLALELIDVGNDGRMELIVAGMVYEGHSALRMYGRQNDGSWSDMGEPIELPEACFDLAAAELDGDPRTIELVAAGRHGILMFGFDANGRSFGPRRFSGTEGVVNIAAGDVDGDGRDEVVYVGFRGVRVISVPEVTGQ